MAAVGLIGTGADANAVTTFAITDVALPDGGQQYTLSGVPLTDGGLLNGTFTILGGGIAHPPWTPYTYSLTTTGGSLPAEAYDYPNDNAAQAIPYGNPITLEFFSTSFLGQAYSEVLHLVFSGDLSLGGVSLLGGDGGPSWECINSFTCPFSGNLPDFGVRYVGAPRAEAEIALATPLPPALFLFGTALAGMGLLGRRRKPSIG